MFKNILKNKWNLLFIILAALVVFSLFAVPKIAVGGMNAQKGKIINVIVE